MTVQLVNDGPLKQITVVHDFNGHEVNVIHGVNGKSATTELFICLYDFTGMHGLVGRNFCYDHFFRKTHA